MFFGVKDAGGMHDRHVSGIFLQYWIRYLSWSSPLRHWSQFQTLVHLILFSQLNDPNANRTV